MKLRNIFIILSMISNAALIAATVIAFYTYTLDSALIIGSFAFLALSISNATLSLHFRRDNKDKS